MTAGRRLYVALKLLDRQMLDRNGRPCGKVDDLELEPLVEGGPLHVTALRAGPGTLLTRLGARRAGRWLERVAAISSDGPGDPCRIPIQDVRDIGNHLTLSVDASELGTHLVERWTRDHLIEHIPGAEHASE
jgi:sporulation protein YlmC with PRC-barrel domain